MSREVSREGLPRRGCFPLRTQTVRRCANGSEQSGLSVRGNQQGRSMRGSPPGLQGCTERQSDGVCSFSSPIGVSRGNGVGALHEGFQPCERPPSIVLLERNE